MKKIFIIIIFLTLFIPISLLGIENVDYEIYDYIVDANIDVSGNLNVKEIIGIKGSYNGYIRDLIYKNNNLKDFTGNYEDFKGSKIYNGTNIEIERVGKINYKKELSFNTFNEEIIEFNLCSNSKNCYEKNILSNGISLKMYNETKNDITYFYIEYLVGNVVVLHEDVAELYYNFIGELFDDKIKNYKLRLTLPFETKEQTLIWAHGPINGNVYLMGKLNDKSYFITENNDKTLKLKNDNEEIIVDKEEDITYYGAYLTVNNVEKNTPIDLRMTFDKDLIMIDHPYLKKSNVNALDKILDIETKRSNEVNEKRKIAKIKIFTTYSLTGIYLLGLLILSIYIYIKHDKERKAKFTGEYNREFIDDYDVTVIEYLFNKNITENAFSTSVLNMIYKKNINFEKISDKDYELTKVSIENLTEAELIIMHIIFDEAGDGKKTTLGKIKKYARKVKGTTSPFLNNYSIWKNNVTKMAKKENFFEDKSQIKIISSIYVALMILILFLHIICDIFNFLTIAVIVLSIVFLIYILCFTKKTIKGIEHYEKWNAFKKFLIDFGRFEEKELPEIALWERYLVYANIFKIAKKLGKTMEIKFNEMNINTNYNRNLLFDYMLWTHLNSTINSTISSSITIAHTSVQRTAQSTYSSGGGFGGGFSSGGGFGGGGGGGRGF